MINDTFRKIYKKVPQDQKEKLIRFRNEHPYKHINVDGTDWGYIPCGQGNEILLCLPDGFGVGEIEAFQKIRNFENDYRIISPSYPLITTITQLLDGIAYILESENVQKVYLHGTSFGGFIAQCFVRKFPDKVDKMILANSMAFSKDFANNWRMDLRILSFIPFGFIRVLAKLVLIKTLLEDVSEYEREFLRAYINELIFLYLTKERGICNCKIMIDAAENYTFTPNDLLDWPGEIFIMEADNDKLLPETVRKTLKTLYPKAYVYTIHNAGHLFVQANREEYLSALKKFLQKA